VDGVTQTSKDVWWFEQIQGLFDTREAKLGDGNVAGVWTLVGAGFRSCPVCGFEVSVCSATRRRAAGRHAISAKVGLDPLESGVCGVRCSGISR
jgi:hypothetical protein